jgi:hypothetical protein
MQRRCLMHLVRSRTIRLVMIAGAALAAGSCTKDDIPTTPSAPFLFSDVAISKFVTPPATNALHPGTPYTVRFAVNYTLDPETDAQRSKYAVFADVASVDGNDNILGVLGFIPSPSPPLTAATGAVSDSISFTVPASGAPFIRIIAGIALRTDSTFFYNLGPRWTVN